MLDLVNQMAEMIQILENHHGKLNCGLPKNGCGVLALNLISVVWQQKSWNLDSQSYYFSN
jgi:hypothetical protein